MSENYEKDREIFLIMAKNGWTHDQALRYYESMHTQTESQTEETEEDREPKETEETETEEIEPQPPSTQEMMTEYENSEIRTRKLKILERLEKAETQQEENELEESKEKAIILEKQRKIVERYDKMSSFWVDVLANPKWEPILRDIVLSTQAQMRGTIPKLVFTFTIEGKTMNISKVFFDKDGKRIIHELTHTVYGENP